MKKNIKKLSILLFPIFLIIGCNEDFLERYPLDEISTETYWRSEADLKTYNNNLYWHAIVQNGWSTKDVTFLMGHGTMNYQTSYWNTDMFSDNVATLHTLWSSFNLVRTGNHVPTPSPRHMGWLGWNFIRSINIGLENYDRANLPRHIVNKYAAEARLFRAGHYAEKVANFGDVPWVEKELNIDSEELYAPRTPREEAMQNVLEDLKFATEHLPDDWGDGADPGRLNRWAALALKSRICLFEGTWRKYHGGADADMWLQEAADAAREVIEDGPYSIYSTGDPTTDYNAMHRGHNHDLAGNPEVIYWEKFELGVNATHQMRGFIQQPVGATKSMVEDYLCTDGLPISLSPLYMGDAQIEDVFENRDPRLRQTILHPDDGEYYNHHGYPVGPDSEPAPWLTGMTYGGAYKSPTGYHIVKNFSREHYESLGWSVQLVPAILIRLGEVMLNYAEAKAELGTITQADLDMSINQLRDRVAMPHMDISNIPVDPRYEADGVSPLIAEIRRERRVELFLEGFRYDDLRRWRQGEKLASSPKGIRFDDAAAERYPGVVLSTSPDPDTGIPYIDVYKGTTWENPVFDESRHYLWPLPLDALTQNPNFEQNPGW